MLVLHGSKDRTFLSFRVVHALITHVKKAVTLTVESITIHA